jgi:hypothetical protein
MRKSSNLPQYKAVAYRFNPEAGYYSKTPQQPEKTPVMRLPYELKVEVAQAQDIRVNASLIIRGKEKFKTGNWKFFTGMQETDFHKWYAGNDYEMLKTGKRLSLCLFHFSSEGDHLTVFYFGRFYIDRREARENFIRDAIPQFQRLHFYQHEGRV